MQLNDIGLMEQFVLHIMEQIGAEYVIGSMQSTKDANFSGFTASAEGTTDSGVNLLLTLVYKAPLKIYTMEARISAQPDLLWANFPEDEALGAYYAISTFVNHMKGVVN